MKQSTKILMLAIASVLLSGGLAVVITRGQSGATVPAMASELSMSSSKPNADTGGGMTEVQIINIAAKGGYTPQMSVAKANTPTLLKISTDSTFDCSAALVIPSLNYHTRLPFTGVTSVNVPPQQPGAELTGLCAMGMFRFIIKFT